MVKRHVTPCPSNSVKSITYTKVYARFPTRCRSGEWIWFGNYYKKTETFCSNGFRVDDSYRLTEEEVLIEKLTFR